MKLGKIYKEEEIEQEILRLPCSQSPLTWENLDERLQYITYEELNDRVNQKLLAQYKIVGKFPDEICLIPR